MGKKKNQPENSSGPKHSLGHLMVRRELTALDGAFLNLL
jgi:hypothetical protein